ncbi:hypothetical protein ASG91_11740 [Phycicoccus sp. Soil802]|nr:hypothetical protein ASG91_11740 [Phycicoccus sp. Soil802]
MLLFAVYVGTAFMNLRPLALVAVVASLALAHASLRNPTLHESSYARLPMGLIAAAALTGAQLLATAGLYLLTPVFVAVAVLATLPHRFAVARAARIVLPPLLAALAVWWLARDEPRIDVHVFLTDGARALLHGVNPYSIDFPNIYGPEETAQYYGPDVVQDGRLAFGFPYPPLLLLTALPGYLLGDVRLSSAIAVTVVGGWLLWRSHTTSGRRAAVLLLCLPGLPSLFAGAWVEPVVVALLAVVVLAARRERWVVAAVALGLLYVSKQYFLVALPCLWLLRPYVTRGRLLAFVGTGAVVTLPFIAWSPASWWSSVVTLQFQQPFRPDSTSIVAELAEVFGWADPTWAGPVSLAAGFAVALVLARTLRPGVATFSLALGLCLAVTFLLSKQAFLNYYLVCAGALVLAAWCRAEEAPSETGMPPAHGERAAYPVVRGGAEAPVGSAPQ